MDRREERRTMKIDRGGDRGIEREADRGINRDMKSESVQKNECIGRIFSERVLW